MLSKTDYTVKNRCKDRYLEIVTDRSDFMFKTKIRKFTDQELEVLRKKLKLDVPDGFQAISGVECMPQDEGI